MWAFSRDRALNFRYLLFLALLSYLTLSFIFFPESIDDAYITLRFAQNLLHGDGLLFNRFEPVEGYSNLTWVVLLALCGMLGFSMEFAMKVLGFISGLLVFLFIYRASQKIFSKEQFRIVPVLLLTSSAFFALWAVDGLETVFYTMLLSMLLYFLLNDELHILKLGSLLGLILLTRPEGILFSVVAVGYVFYRTHLVCAIKLAMVSGLFFLTQLIFRWSYYHELVANTALNKLHPGVSSIVEGLKYLLKFNQGSGYLILPLALIGLLSPRLPQKFRFLLGMFVLAQFIFLLVSGGDFMYGFRFIIPILPVLCILATLGLQTLILKRQIETQILMIGLLIIWNAMSEFQNLPSKTIHINNLTHRASPHFLIGDYLKTHANPNDLVLLSEAGIIPYYSKLATRDYLGLVSAYKTIYDSNYHLNVDHLLSEHPRYIILSFWNDHKGVERCRMESESLILSQPYFQKNYHAVKKFAMDKNESFLNAIYYKYWADAKEIYFRVYERT
jgi:hypothetical protein